MSKLDKVVGVRITEDLYLKLRTISNARGEDLSDFVRRAILKELATHASNNAKSAFITWISTVNATTYAMNAHGKFPKCLRKEPKVEQK